MRANHSVKREREGEKKCELQRRGWKTWSRNIPSIPFSNFREINFCLIWRKFFLFFVHFRFSSTTCISIVFIVFYWIRLAYSWGIECENEFYIRRSQLSHLSIFIRIRYFIFTLSQNNNHWKRLSFLLLMTFWQGFFFQHHHHHTWND